jgi:hypothetical protein
LRGEAHRRDHDRRILRDPAVRLLQLPAENLAGVRVGPVSARQS